MAWVSRPNDLRGNEIDNILAKRRTEHETEGPPVEMSFAKGSAIIWSEFQLKHGNGCRETVICRQAWTTMPEQTFKRAAQLGTKSRARLSTNFRVLTGLGRFKAHCKTWLLLMKSRAGCPVKLRRTIFTYCNTVQP